MKKRRIPITPKAPARSCPCSWAWPQLGVWSGRTPTSSTAPHPRSPSPTVTCAQVFFGPFAGAGAGASTTRYGTRYAHPFVFPSLLCDTEHLKSQTLCWIRSIYNGIHVLYLLTLIVLQKKSIGCTLHTHVLHWLRLWLFCLTVTIRPE